MFRISGEQNSMADLLSRNFDIPLSGPVLIDEGISDMINSAVYT